MSKGFNGKLIEYGKATVTLDASGDGTFAISFKEAFVDAPEVFLPVHRADSGSRAASSITKSGFTLTVTGSDMVSQDLEVVYIAHEKL